MLSDIPFYANTSDDTHCFQASLKMVLKYFLPEKEYSWEELDKITNKAKDMWTWQMAGVLWMKDHGFAIKDYENFDYKTFIAKGEQFLLEEYGKDIGGEMIKHSNVNQELSFAERLLKEIPIRRGDVTVQDIKHVLQEGYVPICFINASKLSGKKIYIGHAVVVKAVNDDTVILNDPGLPPQENREVSFEDFERAWADPTEKEKNIIAFKLNAYVD